MKQELHDFLESNIHLVDSGDYQELYRKAIYDCDFNLLTNDVGELTQLLWDCGADPLATFKHIPHGCYSGIKSALIKIPDHVISIEAFAFSEAEVFKVYIPESVSTIASDTFADAKIDIIQTNMSMSQWMNCFDRNTNCLIDWTQNGCWKLQNQSGQEVKHLIIQNVTSVSSIPFQACSSFKTIEVCEGVTQFGTYAFRHCEELTAIHLPRTLQRIRMYCLADCPKLSTIYYAGSLEEWKNIKKSQTWLYDGDDDLHPCELITADNHRIDLKEEYLDQ